MNKKYILSLDEGTTSARAILFDKNATAIASAQHEIKQIYAPLPEKSGIGLAIFNRMLKASGYTVIKV